MSSNDFGLAIRSFLGFECPVCHGEKASAEAAFCEDCLAMLPPWLREASINQDLYLMAFGQAYRHLVPLHPTPGHALPDPADSH